MQPQHRMRVGDRFWFLCHEHSSPGLLIDEGIFNAALAGALIGELLFDGHINFTREGMLFASAESPLASPPPVSAAPGVPPPPARKPTPFEEHAWHEINSRAGFFPIRDWITFWAAEGPEQVRARLERAGLIQRVRKSTYMPTDWSVAATPSVKMRYAIENDYYQYQDGDDARQYYEDAFLAGLALATNADQVVARDSTMTATEFRKRLQFMVTSIPQQLLMLLGEVDRASTAQPRRPKRR